MTVYAFGLTYSDIATELPFYTFGAATKPTTTQITVWITEYSAQVVARLEALGVADQSAISTTITSSVYEAQYYTIRAGIKQAVVKRVHMTNQETPTAMSEELELQWSSFLGRLDDMPWKELGSVETPSIGVKTSFTETRSPYWDRSTGFN